MEERDEVTLPLCHRRALEISLLWNLLHFAVTLLCLSSHPDYVILKTNTQKTVQRSNLLPALTTAIEIRWCFRKHYR